jgi:hypothetical protein
MKRIPTFALTLVFCAVLELIPSLASAHGTYVNDPVGDQRGSPNGDLDGAGVRDGDRTFTFGVSKPHPRPEG